MNEDAGDGEDEENDRRKLLPELAAGEAVDLETVTPEQHFTQPPPRYSDASLVKALEEENIGRPSTYATIVGTITSREYVQREKGRLVPTDLGMAVSRLLVSTFPDVFNVGFTAIGNNGRDIGDAQRRALLAVFPKAQHGQRQVRASIVDARGDWRDALTRVLDGLAA